MKKRRISSGRNSRRRMKRKVKQLLAAIKLLREDAELRSSQALTQEGTRQDFCVIYESELKRMREVVAGYPDCECGGLLFGHITRTGAMAIDLVTESGGNSKHGHCDFRPDLVADATVANKMINSYAIEELGSFHSPHHLGLSRPSGGDIEMVNRLWHALSPSVKRYIMIIATIDDGKVNLSPYLFERGQSGMAPRKLDMFPLEGVSPFNGITEKEA